MCIYSKVSFFSVYHPLLPFSLVPFLSSFSSCPVLSLETKASQRVFCIFPALFWLSQLENFQKVFRRVYCFCVLTIRIDKIFKIDEMKISDILDRYLILTRENEKLAISW